MLTPLTYYDLMDELEKPGCPICRLLVRSVKKVLDTLLYEYVTEPEMHQLFRSSRGLCNVHGWQLAQMGNVMSIAVLYQGVIDEVLRQLPAAPPAQSRARRLFGKAGNDQLPAALEPKLPCPACQKRDEYESRYVAVFSAHLTDAKLLAAYRRSDGLCIDHFKQVIRHSPDAAAAQPFIALQAQIWQQLLHELAEFERKYDHSNAAETIGSEGDSWLRAIRQLTGDKGVFGLRQPSR